ncbi:MAG TPA: DNA primase [Thermoprotei archaeon]|nr:DNA primase [Thermoprotei archaeon]
MNTNKRKKQAESPSLKDVCEIALLYLEKGLSVIPLRYRDKVPTIEWKKYQVEKPTEDEVREWFSKRRNIGIVCGSISNNLIVVDFDNRETYRRWVANLPETLRLPLQWTWVVETGKGYHVYFYAPEVVRTKPRLKEGIDIKAEGGYVVAPPSIHPSGKQYKFIQGPPLHDIYLLTKEEWRLLKKSLGWVEEEEREVEVSEESEKVLSEEQVLEIVGLLKPYYRKGIRDFIVFYLTGWMRKAGVAYESAKSVVELLAKGTGDEEINQRIYVLDRTYGKRGTPPKEEEMKGKTGLQEIIEQQDGEEKALEVIRRLEEILGVASPFRDSIFELLDYEKQLYAVANLRRLVVARARRTERGMVYKERVAPVAPTRVVVYENPLGGIRKYEVTFEGVTLSRPLTIGPASIEDIASRLKAEGLVYHRRLVDDILSAIVNAFIRKGKAEIKREIEAMGVYWLDGELKAVRYDVKAPSREELRKALELLDEIASYYEHCLDRFAFIVKWGIIAPFIYARKQKGMWIPWLYLYGTSSTGKTTLGELILSIWGVNPEHSKGGSSIDTVPRLGKIVSTSTFPILINEPGAAITKPEIVEVLKISVERTISRGKFIKGVYTDIPALAPLIFTSNRIVPNDDALIRRLYIIRFTYKERISKEKADEFNHRVKPRFSELEAIGRAVATLIMSDPSILDIEWEKTAEIVLRQLYSSVDLTPPEWLTLTYETEEDIYEDIKESIRAYLLKKINEHYTRFVGKLIVDVNTTSIDEVDFEERVRVVLKEQLLPYAFLRNSLDGEYVYFTNELAKELTCAIGDIGGLKSIAELLNWRYCVVKIGKKAIRCATVPLKQFIDFLKL